jgi:hypothetical protein
MDENNDIDNFSPRENFILEEVTNQYNNILTFI